MRAVAGLALSAGFLIHNRSLAANIERRGLNSFPSGSADRGVGAFHSQNCLAMFSKVASEDVGFIPMPAWSSRMFRGKPPNSRSSAA